MNAPILGIIEGFYGDPYSHVARLGIIDTIVEWGWNTYVWAAKLEPRHREQWDMPFTSEELQQFAELSARQTTVNFVIGLTPGSGATNEQVVDKLRPAIDAGAAAVVLCFDDLPVLNAAADHQRIAHAVRDALHVPVWITPTHYAGLTSSPYLDALCDGLGDDIEVMWTGNYVVNDTITVDEAIARREATGGRAPLVWDNAPVNDALMRMHMHLGPLQGREQGLQNVCSGFLWNPMVQARASLVMLETAAAWWDGKDPVATWNMVVDRDECRHIAEATAYRGDLHWPGEQPSREWWETVRDIPDMDKHIAPWVQSARSGARLALAAMAVLDSDLSALTHEEIALLARPLMEWQAHRTVSAFTFGRGPRQRPLATQNTDGRFVLRPGSIVDSESLVDDLVRQALARING
ncbi:MAG: hypothetical protein F2713_06285 [Actinobacteria bacterium]|uniref:Unannotated protein n=1 Tax=freshwater metagenome TaxID=449393 RepID=A0A6J6V901_9ZZZZ|nr:hypothetical protein [Actinomycetota bacterium]